VILSSVERSSPETLITVASSAPEEGEMTLPSVRSATLTDILGKPVKADPVPRTRWEEVFRAQGRKNPAPRIQMIEGFKEGRIEFEGGFEGDCKAQTSLKTVLEEMVRDARKQAA
jgi:hypothetical protein